ncbi:TetR/AcrR family transcriptional regulator [Alicyclobacillus fructus]|uniref:TetR/AcrR family transcriptional regulator n=1 Tax=Alicyclobacillus fructus TaxID=2816082 RepID=UPI001A8FF1AA|nr:TetR/AcrR family transcriptional regulator [Alicyclobacillus fructus]
MTNGHLRIVEQSKKWLEESLFELMGSKPYEEITIKDITDRSQLSRRTFYRHFKTKDDLIDHYLEHLFSGYEQLLKQQRMISSEEVIFTFFDYWGKYHAQLKLLLDNGMFERVLEKANQWLRNMYGTIHAPWHIAGSPDEITYASIFGVGGFFNVLSHWVSKGCPETPQEMTEIVKKVLVSLSVGIV